MTMKIELIDRMGTDLTVVNAARVSYAKIKETFDFNLSTAINDKPSAIKSVVMLLTEQDVDSNGFLLNTYYKHSFFK